MKFTAIIFGFVSIVSAVQQDKFKIPEDKISKLKKISDSCAIEHNVDPGLFQKLADGSLPRDETTNKYLHCFAVKADLVDEVGYILVDKLAALVENHPRAQEFKETLAKCNAVTKENPVGTVVYMNECYAKTSPIILVF